MQFIHELSFVGFIDGFNFSPPVVAPIPSLIASSLRVNIVSIAY